MKIVVLDGHCVNGGDLDWEALSDLGEIIVYEHTPYDKIPQVAKGAEIVITNKCRLDKNALSQLDSLKYIGEMATGYNNIDVEYAAKRGIVVTNIPAYSTESVVQTVFGFIINLALKLPRHFERVRKGEWCDCRDFCFYEQGIMELNSKTLGIVGFGKIGMRVSEIANAFGMKVLVHSRSRHLPEDGTFRYASLDELLSQSDFVSLNCPLTEENKGFIDKERIALMKKSAYIVNTARGALIDEQALADALNSEVIAGAALDVLSEEPPTEDNPLLSAKNVLITPHMAWATREARSRLLGIARENIKAFLKGERLNAVN